MILGTTCEDRTWLLLVILLLLILAWYIKYLNLKYSNIIAVKTTSYSIIHGRRGGGGVSIWLPYILLYYCSYAVRIV